MSSKKDKYLQTKERMNKSNVKSKSLIKPSSSATITVTTVGKGAPNWPKMVKKMNIDRTIPNIKSSSVITNSNILKKNISEKIIPESIKNEINLPQTIEDKEEENIEIIKVPIVEKNNNNNTNLSTFSLTPTPSVTSLWLKSRQERLYIYIIIYNLFNNIYLILCNSRQNLHNQNNNHQNRAGLWASKSTCQLVQQCSY
jgi:hypothetical protein